MRLASLSVLVLVGWLVGCDSTGTYCQSGPKYGTQCYVSPVGNPQGPATPPQERPAGESNVAYR